MKRVIVFFALILFAFIIETAWAQTPTIDNDLSIHIPCALYQGNAYDMTFKAVLPDNTSTDSQADSPDFPHWVLTSIDAATSTDDCIRIDEESLTLVIPEIQYQSVAFGLSLHMHSGGSANAPIYWLPTVVFEIAPTKKTKNREIADFDDASANLVDGLNRFNIELYKKMIREGENLIYSPYSIATALAMAWAGAKNDTADEMKKSLEFSGDDEMIHQGFNFLDVTLEGRGADAQGQDGNGFRLTISNNIWGQTGFPFVPEYMDTLALHYGARMAMLDFAHAPEPSREIINAWISDQTEKKIENLIPPGAIGSLTRLVLTNAIYFNAAWQFPFEESMTVDDTPFHVSETKSERIAMMQQTEDFNYVETDAYQAIELPYDGRELSMLVVLPKGFDLPSFEAKISPETIETILHSMTRTNVRLKMPRFKLEPDGISLKEILQQMGMVKPFTGDADFSGITLDADLYISDVIHKAFINVDEAGTEAAAATAVIFVELSLPPSETIDMTIDRPFIFMIRDMETDVVLFTGRVVNP